MSDGYRYVSSVMGARGGVRYNTVPRAAATPYMGTNWVPTSIAANTMRSGGGMSLGTARAGAA